MKTLAVIGLGLIGGSLAQAAARAQMEVLGDDTDESVFTYALSRGWICGRADDAALPRADFVALALPPGAVTRFLTEHARALSRNAVVFDCAGVKRKICAACFPIAEECGFAFIGGHPMAGAPKSGAQAARATLFDGASMILVPGAGCAVPGALTQCLKALGFSKIVRTDAETHDRLIALTSQLPHALSCAFSDTPLIAEADGFTAGSFRDMTRVSGMDAALWSRLFLDNADNLALELERVALKLANLRAALVSADAAALADIIRQGGGCANPAN